MAEEAGAHGKRLLSIDALRGVAATGVVLCHSLRAGPPGTDSLLDRAMVLLFHYGFVGVYLFFIISGYCIHLRWATRNDSLPFLAFWKRRLRRLYPAYLVSIVLFLGVRWWLDKPNLAEPKSLDLGLHLLLAHNLWTPSRYTICGVYWTLAIEEQLYLAYFLLLWLRRRLNWTSILLVVFGVRVAWFALAWVVHRQFAIDIPVAESAAAAWICWVPGALAVEARQGRVQLPTWMTRLSWGLVMLG
ncbi:MAG: acyltransferase, partial [Myxococcales bacterium]